MVKIKRLLLFCIVILTFFDSKVYGSSYDLGIITEPVSEEQKESIISGTDISIITNGEIEEAIACFDVSERGTIAIGFDTQPRAKVYLYDANGNFLYGYEFNCEGSYGIEFVGDNLSIFFVRGDYIEIYNEKGENLGVWRVLNVEQNQTWRSNIINCTEKTVDENRYHLERDVGLTVRSYSRLIRTDVQGQQYVIYDVSAKHNFLVIAGGIVIVLFMTVVAIGVFRKLKTKW